MGLFDMNNAGGLFGAGDTQGEIDRYAAMPAPEQKRGGVFGSGLGGEDIVSMLLRAAAIAQGDYGAGAQFGANIGAKARAEAEAAQQEAQWRARKQWEWDNLPKDGPEPTTMYRQYKEAGYSEPEIQELMQKDLQAGRTKYVPLTEGGTLAGIEPGQAPRMVITPNPGDAPAGAPASGNIPRVTSPEEAMMLPPGTKFMTPDGRVGTVPGGGTGNGAGGFRP